MTAAIVLALLLAGIVIVPELGGDDDDDSGGDGPNRIQGTNGDDDLDGTAGDDLIRLAAGNDTSDGGAGNDEIRGGTGNDDLSGGTGNDYVRGGPGMDMINGGDGNDNLDGGADNDEINGGYGADRINGGRGNDIIDGGFDSRPVDGGGVEPDENSRDVIRGFDGNDQIFVWGGNSLADGEADDDTITLATGQAVLLPGGGDNTINVLANVTDEQETDARVEEFDPVRDTLLLTVDGVLDGALPPDVEIRTFETVRMINGEEVSGVLVRATIADGSTAPADFEESRVFLANRTLEQIDGATINVAFTEEADLFDPRATLASL